ncbi:hypothetical protein K440DRAFT_558746, partial [Wilcoxina mikolae CBS 423.85]
LVTSQHIVTIESEFRNAAHVEIHASEKDVRRYLEGRIERESRLVRHVKADPGLKETIINTIVEKAKGMFLLVQLHLDSLASKLTRNAVRNALKTLPDKLDDTYHEAMQRIESQNEDERHLAEQVLSWISCAMRPLASIELQHALAVKPGDSKLDPGDLPDEELLTSLCAGLVVIDRESTIIRLVHYTTQEYFKRIRGNRFPNAQTDIATICLTYLSFNVFERGCCTSDEALDSRLQEYPLLKYAAEQWGVHTRGDPQKTTKELAVAFLENNSKLVCFYQIMTAPEYRDNGYSWCSSEGLTGLQVAASFGLEVVQLLVERGADVNARGESYGTALQVASAYGHD